MTIEIDGLSWFVGVLIICGLHALHLGAWRRERRAHLAWWQRYDAASQVHHDEHIAAIVSNGIHMSGWSPGRNSNQRGQA
jgi:hypothetical protein